MFLTLLQQFIFPVFFPLVLMGEWGPWAIPEIGSGLLVFLPQRVLSFESCSLVLRVLAKSGALIPLLVLLLPVEVHVSGSLGEQLNGNKKVSLCHFTLTCFYLEEYFSILLVFHASLFS